MVDRIKMIRLVLTSTISTIPPILLLVYAARYGSLMWESKEIVHGIFMLCSMLTVFAFSATAFRNLPITNRKTRKAFHAVGHTISLFLLFAGWWLIYSSPFLAEQHYCTAHSWIGLLTLISFVCMYVGGSVIFNPYIGAVPEKLRATFKPYHEIFGRGMVLLCACATSTGLVNYQESYVPHIYLNGSTIGPALALILVCSLLTVLFFLSLLALLTRPPHATPQPSLFPVEMEATVAPVEEKE